MAARLNLLATSSSAGFLRCLKAPEGCVLVGSDKSSLEPHVLAHYSQDPGYMKIYHRDAPPNDIYIYLGAHSLSHGVRFRALYDPDHSTTEAIAAVKSAYPEARQQFKGNVLALAYEGTHIALGRQYRKMGIKATEPQLHAAVALFKRTFGGLADFKYKLQAEWKANGGYIITGRGRPLVVPKDKVKDIIAYFCQATGHDFVMRWLYHMSVYRLKHRTPARPYFVDRHDATYWCCRDEPAAIDATSRMIQYGYDALNDELDLTVLFKGSIKVGKDMRIQ